MKVILCKPNEKPQVVDIPKKHTYLDIKRLLGIESPLTCVSRKVGTRYYDFWCDDEGLYPEKKCMSAVCSNANEVLCGNVLIARHDGEGNLVGLTKDDLIILQDDKHYICNEAFMKYSGYPKDSEGNAVVIANYLGFGAVLLNDKGYMLRYSI